MNDRPLPPSPRATDALQTRFARRIAAHLDELAARTPADIEERLRFARRRALERARRDRRSPASGWSVPPRGTGLNFLPGGGGAPWWLRLASVVPLVMLVAGLVLIQQHYEEAQIEATAEIDVAILGSELPPSAYADPGFVEFLKVQE